MDLAGSSVPRRDRHLIDAAHAASTRKAYSSAVLQFVTWLSTNGHSAHSLDELDDLLCDWAHELFEANDGIGRSKVVACLQGLVRYLPAVRHEMLRTRMALVGWLKLRPTVSYPPLPWPVTCVMAARAVHLGCPRFALALLLGFDCLLRLGELLNIRWRDVADSRSTAVVHSGFHGVAIALPRTKTGRNQWVVVEHPQLVNILRRLLASAPRASADDRVFPWSQHVFRRGFKRLCADLRLPVPYVPHSLRHGGATRLFLLGWNMEQILLRGRWASTKSARTYIQTGNALLQAQTIPPALTRPMRVFAKDLEAIFCGSL